MSLTGKLLLVTGGGSGIGAATARVAAREGARVVVADIDEQKAEETAAHLPQPLRHMWARVDVVYASSVDSLLESVADRYDGELPTLLAHSAGIIRNLNGIEGSTEEIFDQTISVNLKGTYVVNRELTLRLKAAKLPGSIVNISSISSCGLYKAPEYSATKGAVNSFSKALAKELGCHGIRVNVVAPGTIDTPFGLGAVRPGELEKVLREQQTMAAVPLGRMGTSDEVAETVVFLLSDKASFITASVFDVNGGVLDQPGVAGHS